MTNDGYYFDPGVAAAYDEDIEQARDVVRDDIPFYVELAREASAAGQAVLELGCGTGRVTIPIAQAGVEVTGIDNAPAMLEVARGKAGGAENPRWVLGDMTSFQLEQRFGLAIIPFRSFLLLLTVEEQKACLTCIREHLFDGGRLALNFFNPSLPAISEWLPKRDRWLRSQPEQGRERWVSRDYDTAAQQLNETRADVHLSDEGAVIARIERNLRLRWVYRYEMEHLLTLTGFAVESLYGWFDKSAFTEGSGEMIWSARRS